MRRQLFHFLWMMALVQRCWAAQHALIVVGLAGEEEQALRYQAEAESWEKLLAASGFVSDHIRSIHSPEGKISTTAPTTRDAVRSHLATWVRTLADTDDAVLVLIGYGVMDGGRYQFQVRGPRLTESDFVDGLRDFRARSLAVFVTGPGGPGLAGHLAGPRRIIITATAVGTEINQTQFGQLWIEVARATPGAPLLELLRAVDKKVAEFYNEHSLARTEYAQLWMEEQPPLEAPFELPGGTSNWQRWTLASLELPAAAPRTASVNGGVPSDSGAATAPPLGPPPDLEAGRELIVRGSTKEEQELLSSAPAPSAYPEEAGLVLSKSLRRDVKPDLSARQVAEYRVLVFDLRLRGLLDRLIEPSLGGAARLLSLKTITPSGKTLEVQPEELIRLRARSGGGARDGEVVPVFAPGVVPGSIVEYSFETSTPIPPFSAYYDEVPLGEAIPIRELRVQLSFDKKTPLRFKLDGLASAEHSEKESPYVLTHEWRWKNLPAVHHEPNTAPSAARTAMLALSSYRDWNEFVDWFRRLTRGADDSSAAIRELAASLTKSLDSDDAKLRVVYDYVSSLRYLAIEIGASAYRPRTAATVLTRQYGDCKDKANLLVALLREAGIRAQFALVGRARPFDESFPGFQFNHALVEVPRGDGLVWLDTTDEACPFGMVPPGDAGQRALVFQQDTQSFQTIAAFAPDYDSTTRCDLQLDLAAGESRARGRLVVRPAGYADYVWRMRLRHHVTEAVERVVAAELRAAWPGAVIESVHVAPAQSLSQPIRIEASVELPLVDAEASCLRLPRPWLLVDKEVDVWKRVSAQTLNGGYPLAFEQTVTVKLAADLKDTRPMTTRGNIVGFAEFDVATEVRERVVIRRSNMKLIAPNLPIDKAVAVREKLDAWVAATEASIPLGH